MSFADDVTDLVTSAVERLIGGDTRGAVDSLRAIDRERLLAERQIVRDAAESARSSWSGYDTSAERASVGAGVQERVSVRDHYICCYCGRRTIEVAILRELSKIFPDDFPYHPHWKFDSCHPVYWTHTASLEHVQAASGGGASDAANLRVACYECNDAKSDLPLAVLEWQLRDTLDDEDWAGLSERLGDLRSAVSDLLGDASNQSLRR